MGTRGLAAAARSAASTVLRVISVSCGCCAVSCLRYRWERIVRDRKRAMPMTAPRARSRQPKQLDAGIFQAEINSFALRLAAEGKAAKTIRTYTEAVQWFAAATLSGQAGRAGWEQVSGHDIQRWMAWLLDRYSAAY